MNRTPVQKALLTVILLALALGGASLIAQEKRAMTFMDIMEMRSVGGGAISPDGKWVLYTVSIPNWKVGRNFTDIFLAPTDGSAPPRQMTFTREQSESSPEWARDSRTFAFLSSREGNSSQVYLMRIDGGEARKLTEQRDGVNNAAFSRDGKWLAYSGGRADARQLYLIDLGKDELKPAQLTRRQTPVNNWSWTDDSARIFFLSPERVDRTERERREKRFDVRITDPPRIPQHLWSVTIADKAEKRWTSGDNFTVAGFDLASDASHALVRSGSLDRHSAGAMENESELYLLNLASGDLRRLTENKMGEGGATFSPDGKWISFTAADDFTWGRNSKLYILPVAGGPLRKMLPDWDHSVGGINWSRDSRTIYFSEGLGVNNHMFALDVASGKLTQLTNETGSVNARLDQGTGLFLVTFNAPHHPADLYIARPETLGQRARWTRISNGNPQVAGFQLGEYETVRWKSTDGAMVEGILIKPVGYERGKRYPLIVQLHGGPASAYLNTFSGSYGTYTNIYAANGYAVFQPNYRGSDNYGEKFRSQIAGDYFRQAYDDIISGVDYLIAQGVADSTKLGMMGWSAGGHWSNWTLTQTDRFKAISSGAGAVNWISMYAQTDVQGPREFYFQGKPYDNWDHFVEVSPLRYIKNAKTPTLIHVGEADPRVPKPQSDELHMALKKLGVPTEYIVYPNMPHGLTLPRYQMVKMVSEFYWMEKWIHGKEWFDWKVMLSTLEEPREERPRSEPTSNNDN